MERRQFVKGLAATPLALALFELGCKDNKQSPALAGAINQAKTIAATKNILNIFVHGMFAIVLDETQSPPMVILKAPDVASGYHKYHARTFTINPLDQNDLVPGWIYPCPRNGQKDLVSFPGGNSKIPAGIGIGKKTHIAIDVSRLKPGSDPHWTVTLPMPDNICGLRATPYNYFAPKPTSKLGLSSRTYTNNDMSADQQMPLTYVLSYQNLDPAQAIKFNGDDNLKVDFGSKGIGRIHLYAEPDVPPAVCHVNMAINQLNHLFKMPLDLQFFDVCNPNFFVKPNKELPCTMNNSIVLCDERSLAEITANTKCSDLLAHGTLEEQFKNVIDLEANFAQTLSVAQQPQAGLAPRSSSSRDFMARKLFQALPGAPAQKPPHNCTSVLCLKRE